MNINSFSQKQARRIKQRANNLSRALQMRKMRIALKKEKIQQLTYPYRYYIGCSGWFYWDWGKSFYKNMKSPQEWFKHYSTHFKTVDE